MSKSSIPVTDRKARAGASRPSPGRREQVAKVKSAREVSRSSPWLWSYAAIAIYAVALGWVLQPMMLVDDAAISFRYAERIAAGKGFTYNDHEHVLGASNPLYTLVLAGCVRAGADPERAARGLGIALFAVSAVLAALIAAQLSTEWAGLAAGLILGSLPFFRDLALCGMESGLAVFLGLSVVLALLSDRPALAAVLLGLAIWNKLDAGMLAVAVAIVWVAVRRTLPMKIALVSALVALPWFAFSLWYFGSILPNSMVVKIANQGGPPADHFWVIRELSRPENGFIFIVIPALAIFAPPVWRAMNSRQRLAAATLGGWFLLHTVAFSAIWLGDYYHWYLTVLAPPLVILACAGAFRIPQVMPQIRVRRLAAAAGAVLLIAGAWFPAGSTLAWLRNGGSVVVSSEVFDFDRRLAGMFLAQYADPSEAVASRFGWVAYSVPNPFNDHTGLNSKRLKVPEVYWVMHGIPPTEGFRPPARPRGFVPLATFNLLSDLAPGCSWFTVFGRPDSAVARKGKRFVEMRLFELSQPQPYSADYGLSGVGIAGNDLEENPPGGATFTIENDHQPLRVIFTPVASTPEVAFELRANDASVGSWGPAPAAGAAGITVAPVPGAENLDKVAVSFLTKRSSDSPTASATWRGVKILIGDAYLDLTSLGGNPLADEWRKHNGAPPRSAH